MDWREVHEHLAAEESEAILHRQAGRCMDCGIPYCHAGCPLGNLIPEWNDLVWKGQWAEASDRLHATNNFPEFTGRICPAPCETSCVRGINQPPVTIKQVEMSIADTAFERDLVAPQLPYFLTGHTVAVVGSGPSGLAAAQQLTRAGHTVAVFERDDRIGGLLRYGVPDFKLEKHLIDRRIAQMEAEGTRFRPGVEIGKDVTFKELRARYDAVLLATGARVPRRLDVPGADLAGIHFAMEYLRQSNQVVAGDVVPDQIVATGKRVVIIGAGDTGSDCLGTALRQGAASVTSLDISAQPPVDRPVNQPWPVDPLVFKVTSSHEEGGEREYLATTQEFLGDGHVSALRVATNEYTPEKRLVPVGADDHDALAGRHDLVRHDVARDDLVGLAQVLHREVDARQVGSGHVQPPRHTGTGGEQDGVVPGAELLEGDVLADLHTGPEPGAFGLHLGDPAVDQVLLELEVRDPVTEQAADPVVPLEDRHRVARPGELLGCRQPGRPRADHRDGVTGEEVRELRGDQAPLERGVRDRHLDLLDGHRRLVDAQDAGRLARRGADPAGELREVVRGVQPVRGLGPLALPDEVVPLRDQVPQRAAGVAGRDTAVHAAPSLAVQDRLRLFGGQVLVHLAPVHQPDGYRAVGRQLAVTHLEEATRVSHGTPPGSSARHRGPRGRALPPARRATRRPSVRTRSARSG